MRAFLIRVLFLLISANVAYGTSGDIYAEEVQDLLFSSSGVHYAFKPEVNSELFCFTRDKGTKKKDTHLSSDSHKGILYPAANLYAFHALAAAAQIVSCYEQSSSSNFYILILRRIIFPRHFFL